MTVKKKPNPASGGNAGTQKPIPGGRLYVVSAPSGAGKSTICKAVMERITALVYSVSYTTRSPRGEEKNGIDYHFISKDEFLAGIDKGAWAEWALVHGNYYGTSADFIDEVLGSGSDVLLDIDVQGAKQILNRYPDSITVFIMPPSSTALRERLLRRGTDSQKAIEQRLANAEAEMEQMGRYRHVIVNDSLDEAVATLSAIIVSARAGTAAQSR